MSRFFMVHCVQPADIRPAVSVIPVDA